jgi:hypothetical protein
MINFVQLKELIIKPVLLDLVAFSEIVMELLVFTCAVESMGGSFLKQSKGKGLGIYYMRPDTYINLWENYIKSKPDLMLKLVSNFNINRMPSEETMIYDLRFATAMMRIFYMQFNERIPNKNDDDELWCYYSTYYNTQVQDKEVALIKYHLFIRH